MSDPGVIMRSSPLRHTCAILIYGIAIGFLLFILVALPLCRADIYELRTEAVKNGAAYWEVQDDGTTTFRWKKEATP